MVPQKEFPLLGFLMNGSGCLEFAFEKDTEERVLALSFRFYVAMALLAFFVIALISYPAYFLQLEGSALRTQLKNCMIYPILNLLLLMLPSPLLVLGASAFLYAKLIIELLTIY